jgi:hypothetical protein
MNKRSRNEIVFNFAEKFKRHYNVKKENNPYRIVDSNRADSSRVGSFTDSISPLESLFPRGKRRFSHPEPSPVAVFYQEELQ